MEQELTLLKSIFSMSERILSFGSYSAIYNLVVICKRKFTILLLLRADE